MAKSPRIGLTVTPASESSKPFLEFRTELAGDSESSNMMIIDKMIGEIQDGDAGRDTKLDALTQDANALQEAVSKNQQDIQNAASSIDAAEKAAGEQEKRIAALEEDVLLQQGLLDERGQKIEAQDKALQEHKQSIDANADNIAQHGQTLAGHDERLQSVEDRCTTNEDDLLALQEDLSKVEEKCSAYDTTPLTWGALKNGLSYKPES